MTFVKASADYFNMDEVYHVDVVDNKSMTVFFNNGKSVLVSPLDSPKGKALLAWLDKNSDTGAQ